MSNLVSFTPLGGALDCIVVTNCSPAGSPGAFTGTSILDGTVYTWADLQAGTLEKPGAGPTPQIEGLHLTSMCDIDTGEVVGFITVILDEDTNQTIPRYFDTTGGALAAAPANSKICVGSAPVNITREQFRLDGSAVGVSTALDQVTGLGTVGNTLTVTAPFKSLTPIVLRETQADDGTGAVSQIVINGLAYNPGPGADFLTLFPSWSSANGETFSEDVEITVSGAAFLEVQVTRD